ncbi:serine hydrolase domain-containing protein [Cytophagaceae bacterium ABcell3]|nr:serine hydrolase domain-containing protein [Cytophagaceae bacterium ABcell3]
MKYGIILMLLGCLYLSGCELSKIEGSQDVLESAKVDEDSISGTFDVSVEVVNYPEFSAHQKRIDSYLQRLHKRRLFNGSVLVSKGGEIIFKKSYGYSNFERKEPLLPESSFHLASVSKQFTAVSVLMLRDEGKINLDDDITEYMPELPYEGIKVRHLLNHTSGLINFLNYVPTYLCYWDSCKIATNTEMPYILSDKQPRLQFKPGTRFAYNNTGYVLLAHLVEKVSGMTFQGFVQERIFDVLGMTNSRVVSLANEPIIPNRVYNYQLNRWGYQPFDDDIRNGFVGEKGIYSSVEDLFRWDQALYSEILLKEETLEELMGYTNLDNGRRVLYGFGWRKIKDNPDMVYHYGHWKGARACIIRYYKDNDAIIILNNTGSSTLKGIANKIKKELGQK